jgi:hypothetical protein
VPNIPLTGKNNCQLDHTSLITATKLSVDKNIPLQVRKGNAGPIGIGSGVADVTGTITFAVPATGTEVDFDEWEASPAGKTMTFEVGAGRRLNCVGSKLGGVSYSSEPGTGAYDVNAKFTSTEAFFST